MASVTPRPASSLTTLHARTHVAVAVKLLIVRAGRASALALALASQAKLLPLPFYTGPGSDVCLPVSSSHHPAPIHLAGPTCPPHPGKNTVPFRSLFIFSEARNTQRERARATDGPQAAYCEPEENARTSRPPGLLHVQRHLIPLTG